MNKNEAWGKLAGLLCREITLIEDSWWKNIVFRKKLSVLNEIFRLLSIINDPEIEKKPKKTGTVVKGPWRIS